MSEPYLPVLPDSFLKNKPKLSGICPSRAMKLMFLVGAPAGLLVGVAAHYLGIVLGAIVIALTASSSIFIALFNYILLAIFLFYPLLVGAVAGEIVGKLGKRGHCRSARIAGLAGALSSICVYVGHSVISLVSYGGFQPLIANTNLFGALFHTTITGTPWWIVVIIVIEVVVLISSGIIFSQQYISGSAYCETHSTWYSNWKTGSFPIEFAVPLADALRSQDVSGLENSHHIDSTTFPRLSVMTRGCPACQSCDVELSGEIYWQEISVDKKGNTSTKSNNKDWFDTMIPPVFGYALEKTLQLTEPFTKKKKK